MRSIIIVLVFVAIVYAYSFYSAMDNLMRRVTEEGLKDLRKINGADKFYTATEIRDYLIDTPESIPGGKLRKKVVLWFLASDKNIRKRCRASELVEESSDQAYRLKLVDKQTKKEFDWDDPRTYEWEIQKEGTGLLTAIIYSCFGFLSMLFTFFGIMWMVDLFLPTVALILSGILYVYFLWFEWSLLRMDISDTDYEGNAAVLLTTGDNLIRLIPVTVMTSLLLFICSSSQVNLGSFFEGDASKLAWFLYAIELTINEVLYDVLEAIGVSAANINPLNFTGRVISFIIKLHLIYGGVRVIVLIYKSFKDRVEVFNGTVKDCYAKLQASFLDHPGVTVKRVGVVNKIEEDITIGKEKFLDLFIEEFDIDLRDVNPYV